MFALYQTATNVIVMQDSTGFFARNVNGSVVHEYSTATIGARMSRVGSTRVT